MHILYVHASLMFLPPYIFYFSEPLHSPFTPPCYGYAARVTVWCPRIRYMYLTSRRSANTLLHRQQSPEPDLFRRFCGTPQLWLTRGRVDSGLRPGLLRGRYPKSGTPHLKQVISVYLMQTLGNRKWQLKDDD
jgi:hypothetical protein